MTIYKRVENISRLELVIWCFLLLGFILFNIGFWIERWSVSDLQISTLKSVCFDRSNDRCCQTFEDRDETIPGWIIHCNGSMIAAYIFAILTFSPLVYGFLKNWESTDASRKLVAVFSISSLATALCLIISVGLFNEHYTEVSAFQNHRRGPSFYISIICIIIYLAVSLLMSTMYFCCNVQLEYTSRVESRIVYQESRCNRIHYATNIEPTVTARQREYRAKIGDDLTLTCTINKNGTLQNVIWERHYNNKRKLLSTSHPKSRYCQESQISPCMTIKYLKLSDAGKYQCLAINEYGTGKSEDMCVNVLYPPTVQILNEEYKGEINSELTVECHIKSFPKPIVQWRKFIENDWTVINTSDPRYSIDYANSVGSLTIDDLLRTDAGKYTCVVINDLGEALSNEIRITVEYPPNVVAGKTEYNCINDSGLQMDASIDACPEPNKVYWETIVDGETKKISNSENVYSTDSSSYSVLQINRLLKNHSGLYQCIARNDIGIGKCAPISVTVIELDQRPDENDRRCVVCINNPKEVIFLECKHSACCQTCADEIMNGNRLCPLCRAFIERVIIPYD